MQKNEFEGKKFCSVGIGFHETSPNFILGRLILHHHKTQFKVLVVLFPIDLPVTHMRLSPDHESGLYFSNIIRVGGHKRWFPFEALYRIVSRFSFVDTMHVSSQLPLWQICRPA